MKNRLLYNLLISLLRFWAFLPFGILYSVSDGMYFIVYYILRYRRRTVRNNLRNSFPEKSDRERKKIERKFYSHFCDCIVETIKLLRLTDKEMNKRIQVTNGNLIDQLAEDGAPIILYLGHYGNWEWTPAVTLHYTHPTLSGQIYRPLHNCTMEQVMLTIRSRFHTLSIPQKSAFRTLLRMRQENRQFLIGFVADQRPNSGNLYHWTRFLNQDTAYSTGGEEIGKRTGLFMTLVVSIAANVLYPMGQTATASQILANYNCQMNLNRLSPYYLYSEAVSTIMNPQVRSTNIILPQQLSGAINGYLSLGQSLLLVWPHLTGLLALTAVVFAVSYISFMRKEIRGR